jgi:hypothetical protein
MFNKTLYIKNVLAESTFTFPSSAFCIFFVVPHFRRLLPFLSYSFPYLSSISFHVFRYHL